MATRRDMFYVVECTAGEVMAEFYVNDIPIARRGREMGYFYGVPVNENILKGRNEIAFVVEPGDRPSRAVSGENGRRARKTPDPKSVVSMRLGTCPRGAVLGGPDFKPLASIQWSPPADGPVTFPLVRSARVDLDPPFGPWAWEASPPVRLDEAAMEALNAFVWELHLSMKAGFPDPYIEANRLRFAEGEQAHFLPEGERAATARNALADIMEDPGWEMAPLESLEPDFRLCGRDRLVQLIASDWDSVLRNQATDGGAQIFFRLIMGRIDGEWMIVR